MDGWVVYLLRCGDGSLYCGSSNNLERRLKQHQAGKGAKYTRSHLPVTLVWSLPTDRHHVRSLEAHIKRLSKAEKEALVLENK